MNKVFGLGVLAMLTMGQTQGAVTLDDWGAIANTASATCSDDTCDTLGTLIVDALQGGNMANSAIAASGTWPNPGSAQAQGTVATSFATPMLTAGAISDTNALITAQSFVIQAYEYTGAGTVSSPETLSLTWNFTGDVENPDNDIHTGFTVFVGMFDAATPIPELTNPLLVLPFLITQAIADGDDNVIGYTPDGTATVNDNGTISHDVANGEQLYLAMGLMASAAGANAEAMSLSTLAASFNGSPALTPAINSVPLPPAGWLLGIALIGLVGLGRRTRGGAQ